ncbi:glycosyltransferase family 4 protein [Flavobacterium sp. 3HN19-14]|uniref:glycosyltransferase family 4 protein n=1 Tax=Flavobacterium sp. 3HN19-14 TaxID=3448133 RepID=UPI003EE0B31E
MPRLKIFVDCHVFDSGFQGTRTYIHGLYTEMIKHPDIQFFLASGDSGNLQEFFGQQENITYVAYKSHNKFLRLLFEIPKIIKKHQIDFAHFQYIVPPFKNCRYIVTTHDVLFIDFPEYFPVLNRLKNTFLYRMSARLADIRLTVSDYSKEKIAEHFKMTGFEITPNAVDAVFFEKYDKQTAQQEVKNKFALKDYIIYVSRWEPRKKQDLVLKAFVDLQLYKNHQLLFIGSNTIDNTEYYKIFEPLDNAIKSQIKSLEKVDFKEMLLLLRGAKASVYPSVAEGFGIPPLEAIAAGIPTICSDKTAMSDFDFLKDFYFDPYNQLEFNNQLLKILNNDFTAEFAEISRQIQSKYNWEKSAAMLKNALPDSQKL